MTPEWLQEAKSYRHSPRSVILVGLEDGTFAVLDDHVPGRREYIHCTILADAEEYLRRLAERALFEQRFNEQPSVTLDLKELGLE